MDTLYDWLDEWELTLRGGIVVDGTIEVYLRCIRQFLGWLAEKHPAARVPADITPAMCRAWMAHLNEAGKAEATRRVRGIALRKWLRYVADEPDSGLTANPARVLELPMPTMPPVPIVHDDTLTVLLRSMSSNDFTDRRDTAIIRMLLDTGCRRAEIVGIDLQHLDMKRQEATVTGKGNRTRLVPFTNKTALALRKYLRVRDRRPAAGSKPLFLSMRPDRSGDWRLTGGGLAEMLSRRCETAGLGHLHPHQFRHTWAADLKEVGMNDAHLERLGGWTSPLMVRRYGNAVAEQQARNAARRLARGDRV